MLSRLSNTRDEDLKKLDMSPASGLLASLCKAASDPLRLDIMRVLSNDSFGVQELATIFSMPQPGMSHHLKVLTKSGLLATRRQGNSIFYRRALLKAGSDLYDFQSSLFATIDALPLADAYQTKIDQIYAERSEQSRTYFARNVDKFEENQGMLCELSQYLPNLKEFLELMALPRASRVMEVGPGQGLLLKELATRFDDLVALDNSAEMLALAKGKLSRKENIQFVQSSLEAYELHNVNGPHNTGAFNAVVLNMVLHHMSSPMQALKKVRDLVGKNGFLLIADLCSHNQEWTRASCGDVWLGFDPQDLREWAHAAGFVEDQSTYLGLKNGFQIQLKLFHAI